MGRYSGRGGGGCALITFLRMAARNRDGMESVVFRRSRGGLCFRTRLCKIGPMHTRQPILQAIRARPALYLGRKSLTGFRDFMNGYIVACGDYGINESHGFHGLPDHLHDWAAYRTRHRESTSGWSSMIIEATGSEDLAFNRFFELLDEYENRRPTVFARVRNSGTVLISFTDDPGCFAVPEGEEKSSLRGRFHSSLKWFDDGAGNLEIVDPEVFARIKAQSEADAEADRCALRVPPFLGPRSRSE